MQYARARGILNFGHRCAAAHRVETELLRCVAYPFQRHPCVGGPAEFRDKPEGIIDAVIAADHAQARGSALHRIALDVYRESPAHIKPYASLEL